LLPSAVAPRITRLHLSAGKFRAAFGGATIHAALLPPGYARSACAQPTKKKSKHPKPKPVTAAVITYQDSFPATTTFTVLKPLPGIRKGHRRVAPPARPAKGHKYNRCTRYVQAGNTRHFSGRLNGRKLRPGTYRLQAIASIDGQASKPVTVSFKIVR
jgi:hypothetical protein